MFKLNTALYPFIKTENGLMFRYSSDFVFLECDDDVCSTLMSFENKVFEKKELENELNKVAEYDVVEQIMELLLENNIIVVVDEENRYITNLTYYSLLHQDYYAVQDTISNARICVLGLGGSSFVVQQLAMLGVGFIHGVDFDKVELKNLNRQSLFDENDIGKLKTTVLQKKINVLNSSIEMTVENKKITSVQDVIDILDANEYDLVISAIDDPIIDATSWVHDACKKAKVNLISGGVWVNLLDVSFYNYASFSSPCYNCVLLDQLDIDENSKNYITAIKSKSFSNYNTSSTFNVSISAGILVNEIYKILTDSEHKMTHAQSYRINTETFSIERSSLEKHTDCIC